MDFIKTILLIAYACMAGYGFLRTIIRDKNSFSVLGWLPISFVSGFGILAVFTHIAFLFRLNLSFWLMSAFLLPFFILSVAGFRMKFDLNPFYKLMRSFGLVETILIFVILFGVISVFLMSVSFPLHFWDSRAIWGLKAKMLFYGKTIFSPYFLDPSRIQPHFRYPLLYPLSQAFIYFGLGKVDDWAVMLLIGMYFPLLAMYLCELLRLVLKDRSRALMGCAVLSVLPVFYMMDGPAHSGYADTPLALYYLVSFGLLFLWKIKGDKSLLTAGLIISGFLPLVKNDGTVLLILNLIWAFWPDSLKTFKAHFMDSLRPLLTILIIAAIAILPWVALRSNIPNIGEEKYIDNLNAKTVMLNLNRAPRIAAFFFNALLGTQADMMGHKFLWGGLFAAFSAAALGAFLERNILHVKLFFIILLFFVFMGGIYVLAPPSFGMDSNFFRISLSITPIMVLFTVMQADRIRSV